MFYGVVVVFNPTSDVVKNILTYASELDKVFIYDNSYHDNSELFLCLMEDCNVEYIYNGENDGISKAINSVVRKIPTIEDGWLLTMDQDSSFQEGDLKKMISYMKTVNNSVGIVSPFHVTSLNNFPPSISKEEKLTVMTSGNFLNLSIHREVGGFDEKYFIDCVDWEYCLKLNKNGFKVIRLNYILLKHSLGTPIFVKTILRRRDKVILNHNYIRKYFMARNKLLISCQYFYIYPKFCWKTLRQVFLKIFLILFFMRVIRR
ncbi:glycosyltransferase [Marinomonas sp. GJ51-6]|uniref:glycosyltransferase n=1 Tax=Marinomonas sp. GJ51-6 TaxID=2992802 RepID=UPI0029349B8F|nr:glycosyltransferase [Marinomonas sp. GJ51-6]WOD06224.1 glycosyltransferase [Marinomonas sp. GJ51-6]